MTLYNLSLRGYPRDVRLTKAEYLAFEQEQLSALPASLLTKMRKLDDLTPSEPIDIDRFETHLTYHK